MAEAIGYVVHLLSISQLDGQLAKLLPAIAQLYKKHQDHYYISQVRGVRTSCPDERDGVCCVVHVYGGGRCMQEEV